MLFSPHIGKNQAVKLFKVIVTLVVLVGAGLLLHLHYFDLSWLATAADYLFFPLLGLALTISIAWRFVPVGRMRTRLQIAGTVLFFMPPLLILVLWDESIRLVLKQEGSVALIVLAGAGAFTARLLRPAEQLLHTGKKQLQRKQAVLLMLAVGAGIFGVLLVREFAEDLFRPRIAVNGRIERQWVTHSPRSVIIHRYIQVNGRSYEVTYDVYSQLHPGELIVAEAGAGSKKILALL